MMKEKHDKTVWIVAGPTASGKSALAVELAEQHNGVIINADSMQIYQEIPVISAQPSMDERRDVPHLLYGFHPITMHYSAADWASAASKAIEMTVAENRQPILVGGSGLYLKALTEGFSPMPEVPAHVRKHVCDLYDMLGAAGFHDALKKIDPVIAERLHPTDRQRCIRAREIYEVSGEPLSAWQSRPKHKVSPHLHFKSLVLLPEREWLHERINRRFGIMTKTGALEEAAHINRMDIPHPTTGMRAVGLQALRDQCEGFLTMEEAIEHGQTLTRQYAKRQYTWFRGQALPNALAIDNTDSNALKLIEPHFA